jgi:hypothetical protein
MGGGLWTCNLYGSSNVSGVNVEIIDINLSSYGSILSFSSTTEISSASGKPNNILTGTIINPVGNFYQINPSDTITITFTFTTSTPATLSLYFQDTSAYSNFVLSSEALVTGPIGPTGPQGYTGPSGTNYWTAAVSPAGAIYYNGGNVGINVSSPQNTLNVNGTVNFVNYGQTGNNDTILSLNTPSIPNNFSVILNPSTGTLNPLTLPNDILLIGGGGARNGANMTIGTWNGYGSGIRITSNTITLGGSGVDGNSSTIIKNLLTVTGNIVASGTITTGSDYRIKEDIIPLDLGKYSIDNLNPVYFKFKNDNKESIGLIAHELQAHYPFLVEGEKDGEQTQTVNYSGLIGVLIKEIQELKKRVKELENKIE